MTETPTDDSAPQRIDINSQEAKNWSRAMSAESRLEWAESRIAELEAAALQPAAPTTTVEIEGLVGALVDLAATPEHYRSEEILARSSAFKRAHTALLAAIEALANPPAAADGGWRPVPDELRRLSESATHGPWVAASTHSSVSGLPVVAQSGRPIAGFTWFGLGEKFRSLDNESLANAALTAGAVNFVRSLIANSPAPPQSGDRPEGSEARS